MGIRDSDFDIIAAMEPDHKPEIAAIVPARLTLAGGNECGGPGLHLELHGLSLLSGIDQLRDLQRLRLGGSKR